LVHVLDTLEATENYKPEIVAFYQCTAPVRHPLDVERALQTFHEREADSLLSAMPFHLFIWQAEGDYAAPVGYDPRNRPRRQDKNIEWMENGSFYLFKPWVLREHNSRLGGKIAVHEMDEWCSLDINGPRDLQLAEWFLANYQPEK
jgi:N-acylneuraminate cytidylyltransferase